MQVELKGPPCCGAGRLQLHAQQGQASKLLCTGSSMQRGPSSGGQQFCPGSPSGHLHCSNTLCTHLQLHFCNVSLVADDLHHGLHLQVDSCIADMAPGLQGSCHRADWQHQPLPLAKGSPHLISG